MALYRLLAVLTLLPRTLEAFAALSPLPGGSDPYSTILRQASEATKSAIKDGLTQIEIEFPAVKGKLDVSLGETLDANRAHARELARAFSAPLGSRLWVLFPDDGEAKLAQKAFGQTPFTVASLPAAVKGGLEFECGAQLVVQPGFNIDEWISLQKLARPGVPMVVLNGGLDKVRGSYYPRIFYGGLHRAREAFLQYFEPVLYLKPLPNGWIYRKYPEPWQVVFAPPAPRGKSGRGGRSSDAAAAVPPVVLQATEQRPEYNDALKLLYSKAYSLGSS